jgi:hypothetical protein
MRFFAELRAALVGSDAVQKIHDGRFDSEGKVL